MNNQNSGLPAMPTMETVSKDAIAQAKGVGLIMEPIIFHQGLTKREYFASMAMQGMLSNNEVTDLSQGKEVFAVEIAENAIFMADALLDKVSK